MDMMSAKCCCFWIVKLNKLGLVLHTSLLSEEFFESLRWRKGYTVSRSSCTVYWIFSLEDRIVQMEKLRFPPKPPAYEIKKTAKERSLKKSQGYFSRNITIHRSKSHCISSPWWEYNTLPFNYCHSFSFPLNKEESISPYWIKIHRFSLLFFTYVSVIWMEKFCLGTCLELVWLFK